MRPNQRLHPTPRSAAARVKRHLGVSFQVASRDKCKHLQWICHGCASLFQSE